MNLSLSLCFRRFNYLLLCMVIIGCPGEGPAFRQHWNLDDLRILQSLHLSNLPPVTDPGNAYIGNDAAADLGRKLFFSPQLSQKGDTSCAHCHQPKYYFTSGKALDGKRNTPTVVGSAAFSWQFWDGRADSLWSQALFPLEDPTEHALSRLEVVHIVLDNFQDDYKEAFGATEQLTNFLNEKASLPRQASPVNSAENWELLTDWQRSQINQIYASIGKALAAYQARLMPAESRFDKYVEAVVKNDYGSAHQLLSPAEEAGLRLFISDRGRCIRCHSGPLFSNGGFTATAVPGSQGDEGRLAIISQLAKNEFNCLSQYADKGQGSCDELIYVKTEGEELRHAFKVPTLRNISFTAPYMHNGSFTELSEVLDYYNRSPRNGLNHTELEPLYLFPYQLKQLEKFLLSLESGIAPSSVWGRSLSKETIK
ncbi:cytochrome-c peroxidase [Photobacterium rosenbergii]|uniref:Cytochrome c peroxidase n=1 Tax=Photobacterium rosenbergii TaxID=294936 RepID=A0ABU3ZCX2_9GAMM|nr:cytochrome c peroxidase [Photobacterium rosenbergii]MDV5167952.1 cytochrome c peroxidase [Photobacterium rosenbergii]